MTDPVLVSTPHTTVGQRVLVSSSNSQSRNPVITTTVAKVESLRGVDRVEGPFQGYHNVTYAVRLDATSPLGKRLRRMKLREPRPGVFWFDLRVFLSEDQLLPVLQERIPRIPLVADFDGVSTISFIEGRTLGSFRGQGGSRMVSAGFLDQIEDLFRHLMKFELSELPAARQHLCTCAGAPAEQSSTDFLRGWCTSPGTTYTHRTGRSSPACWPISTCRKAYWARSARSCHR